ncbi:WRKY transcription factor 55 [Acorus gramineus]|uniref:WRKY transcription factor 55 n=1 Tax=Acorus gramineus TaxID=55184 RepID=A0AAV9AML4_ACOGR|nr:WRKY transcription factor 55 [Acorus gramineus]
MEVSGEMVGPSVRRPAGCRKRKDGGGKQRERVPAPPLRTGGMEIPPDDGYTWRKYGQKDILGSRFPRSYYRCTHKNYGCDAKKQVQRLDDDPNMYEVTYGDPHTCRTSPTPLLIFSGPATVATSTPIQLGMGRWASVGLDVGHEHVGPSAGSGSQHAREVDCPVTELADVMFNSGSSGSSSMEAILGLKTR